MANKGAFIELHILQNFAPSNLNRDDTNTPKTCDFGGWRRARISSQCIKRSIRTHPEFERILEGFKGIRTKLLLKELKSELLKDYPEEDLNRILPVFIDNSISGMDKDNEKTKVLFYLGRDEIKRLADLIRNDWEKINQYVSDEGAEDQSKSEKRKKEKESAAFFKEIAKDYKPGTKVADVAMFGRMLAEHPTFNVDAACQVAHAISTNKVNVEMDFYTAVDDLSPKNETGAGMMGTVEYDSACFYRYTLIDLEQLRENLGSDEALVKKAVEAFLRCAVMAVPSGKQNGFAAQNPPDFVFATVRKQGAPWSLANAFIKPVYRSVSSDLMDESINKLAEYWTGLSTMYGIQGLEASPACSTKNLPDSLKTFQTDNVDSLVSRVLEVLS